MARKDTLLETGKSSQVEGNVVTFINNDSEEERDFQASFAIEESNRENDVEAAASWPEQLKQESALIMMSNKSINYQDDWIVDLGCSNHMTGGMNKVQRMTEYKGDQVMVMAKDFKTPITHIDSTLIFPRFSLHRVQLQNVHHVPRMKKNLLSVSQLTSLGNYVVFGPKDVKVYCNSKPTSPPLMERPRS